MKKLFAVLLLSIIPLTSFADWVIDSYETYYGAWTVGHYTHYYNTDSCIATIEPSEPINFMTQSGYMSLMTFNYPNTYISHNKVEVVLLNRYKQVIYRNYLKYNGLLSTYRYPAVNLPSLFMYRLLNATYVQIRLVNSRYITYSLGNNYYFKGAVANLILCGNVR